MQSVEFNSLAVVGALTMIVLSVLFALVWRALRADWAPLFSFSYLCSASFYALDRYTLPTGDHSNPIAALISMPTILLLTLGMMRFVGLEGRIAQWLTRIFTVTVVGACALAMFQLISRAAGFGIISFLFVLQILLALWAVRREPGHGHGLVVIALSLYPLLFVLASLGVIPVASLRYWFIFPFAVTGMVILTTGLLRAQRRHEEAQRSLQALNESLERRVVERTEQLSTAVARADAINEELIALNTSRARLLAAACHDLRQPAHALGLLADAAYKLAPPTTQEPIADIRRCSNALSDMLDMLLDITQLEEDRYRPTVAVLSLDELFDELRTQFDPLAQRKSLSLTVESTSLHVMSDRHLLRRMLMNLVSNGIKYTSRGGVHVRATASDEEVFIEVMDTGPGIPPDKTQAVFADYVRLDATRQIEGLGIGLPIVKRGADLLGHRVWLRSEVGVGTSFFLAVARASRASAVAPALPEVRGQGQWIALLDNDEAILTATQGLLKVHGFSVAIGQTLEALKAQLHAGGRAAPDLLISDFHLDDGMNGLQLVKGLRQASGWEAVRYVLMTGNLDADVAGQAAAMGVAVAYKPVRPKHLLHLIGQILQREPSDGARPGQVVAGPDGR